MSVPTAVEQCAIPGTRPVTWNPVTGCSRANTGCEHCCAERMTARIAEHPNPKISGRYSGLLNRRRKFNGVVKLHEDRLLDPLKWKNPCTVFVDPKSDLFYEKVPDDFIFRVISTVALCPRHTFIVLTKRYRRMLQWMKNFADARKVAELHRKRFEDNGAADAANRERGMPTNLWLLGSASHQATYDLAAMHLSRAKAAVLGVSLEPLMGPIDLRGISWDWVIVGGENGNPRRVRPYDPAWPHAIIRQCKDLGIPVYHKQVGSHAVAGDAESTYCYRSTEARKGGEPAERPEHLRVEEWPKPRTSDRHSRESARLISVAARRIVKTSEWRWNVFDKLQNRGEVESWENPSEQCFLELPS
jgi:protein gp37